jgi:hypothetical protein
MTTLFPFPAMRLATADLAMMRHRPWLMLAVAAVLLALAVQQFGDALLGTAWGAVALNVISGFFLLVLLAGLFFVLHRFGLREAKEFFGVGDLGSILIYTSAHADSTTATRAVLTAEERDAADKLADTLAGDLSGSAGSLARLVGVNLSPPQVVVDHAPLPGGNQPISRGGLILVGGPTRNSLTEDYLQSGHALITFDDERKKFLRRGTEGQLEELENSHQLALVQKVLVDGAVAIMAFGFGEVGTVAAVNHLVHEWRTLARQYGHCPFARLMLVHANGRLSIQEDLVDQMG